MRILSFLWIVPFFCFLGGYQIIHYITDQQTIIAPAVVGLHINDAIKLLSTFKLNARILSEKEDSDLPEGIVLDQSPPQGQKIKSHQSLFLVVTRMPAKPQASSFIGLNQEEIKTNAHDKAINIHSYPLESASPQGVCIAQNAQNQEILNDNAIVAYYSDGMTPIRIMPDFIGKKAQEVKKILQEYNIDTKIEHIQEQDLLHTCSCEIIEQKPQAGTLINLKKPLLIELRVK